MGKPIETFVANFQRSLENQTFVRLMLSRPLKDSVERVVGRVVDIKGESKLSLIFSHAERTYQEYSAGGFR